MKLVPPLVFKFESNAEKKIFEALKEAKGEGITVLHSLNLPEHAYKQWAEADFVVISSAGVMVLEVKGGRVGCEEGIWSFTNRYGQTTRKSEGPLDQARSARYALEDLLRFRIGAALADRINFGFGVVFPDIEFDTRSIELPPEIIFDRQLSERRDLSGWFRRLAGFWAEKTGRKAGLESQEVDALINAMRPTFDIVPPLVQRLGETMGQLIQLTELQYRYLDILVLQKRVVVEGGAGTGKTLLAIEAARRLADEGRDVLFVCRSSILNWHIRTKLSGTTVRVLSLVSLTEHMAAAFQQPDILIVDEGQDFFQTETILLLDSCIRGGFQEGRWLFFMDQNNQGSIYGEVDADALQYVKSAGAPWPLVDNCRNTYHIALQTMKYTGADIGRCKALGHGLKVVETNPLASRQEVIVAVESQLEKWIDREHIPPGEITILSPLPLRQSVVNDLGARWRRKIHVIDETFGGQWISASITFCTIRDFKGLENRCVMLVDLDALDDSVMGIAQLYVGMTRANANLWIAVTSGFSRVLRSYQCANEEQLADYIAAKGKFS